MNAKKTVTIILFLFVVAAIGTVVIKGINTVTTDLPESTSSLSLQSSTQIVAQDTIEEQVSDATAKESDENVDVVYYFMTAQRCQSCMKIEAYAKQAVEQNFAGELEKNELAWRIIDVDEPANRHFIVDYELFTKSVVLVKYRNGIQVDWKNLDKVWSLLGDETAFRQYIADEVKAFLTEV